MRTPVWRATMATVVALLFSALPARAENVPFDDLIIEPVAGGTRITYHRNTDPAVDAPVRIVPLRWQAVGDARLQVRTDRMMATILLEAGQLPRTPIRSESTEAADMPGAPIAIIRQGRMRGVPIAVVQVSPVFTQSGALRALDELEVFVPDAQPLSERAIDLTSAAPPTINPRPPANPSADAPAIKVWVAQAGIQRITGSALAGAGLDLASLNPALIQVHFKGDEVALEERLAVSGRMGAGDEIRFYAASVGDRWNMTDTYWLSVEAVPGLRMSARDATAVSGPAVTTAIERGVWRNNTVYDSILPGPDGDHWFAFRFLTGPGLPPMTTTAVIVPSLPVLSGDAALRLRGSASVAATHTLVIHTASGGSTASWPGAGDWQTDVSLPVVSNGHFVYIPLLTAGSGRAGAAGAGAVGQRLDSRATAPLAVQIALQPGLAPDPVSLDSLDWAIPVTLRFDGRGGVFSGGAAVQHYALSGTPDGRVLYDVTDQHYPQVVSMTAGAEAHFQHGPARREYVLAGPGTLVAPVLSRPDPVDVTSPRNANVVYIAPAAFQTGISPLVALRRSQGYTVTVVDPQSIYDAWSYGQVSPDAIRNFLRHAAATWRPSPAYVTLVGDGTSDPYDYTGKGEKNVNVVPPYLAMVDPWIKETACDTCYAQLDGDDPLTDPFPDLAIGRLPVKNTSDLAILISKTVAYEMSPIGVWQSRIGFLADNYRSPDGTPDPAGDFSLMADGDVALQPPGADVGRLYYDPYTPTARLAAWREPDALAAYTRTFGLFNRGSAILNYYGHGHQFQMAATSVFTNPFDGSQAAYLFYWYDPDRLSNGGQLPIVLQMTCLTTAFQTPLFSGETIDERLVLAQNRGAIAVWGSSGFGVAYGHMFLQRGLYTALWSQPASAPPTLGELTLAAYYELLTRGSCCQESARTYILLGDPAMPVRVFEARRTYLPVVAKP